MTKNISKATYKIKQYAKVATAFSFAFLASTCSVAHAEALNSTTPITPHDMVKLMGSGVDSTWSEVPNKIADYTPQASIAFADKGFKHVRLRLAQDPASATWSYLDAQIQDALDNGMIPIIANQSHAFEDNPTAQNQADWVQWWQDMAEHYKDYPYELMFDLIVEIAASSPLSDEPIDQLNQAYEQAVTAIRNAGGNSDKRIVIFSAHKRSDATRMNQLDIPTQGNGFLIGEFHEGYASGPSTDPENPHYYWDGGVGEIQLMTERVNAALAWSQETGIPIWEGAWMPGNYNKGDDYDVDRQIKFLTDFIKVLNDKEIPHAVNATKKFYDVTTNEWNELEPVVDAIIALSLDLNTDEDNQEPVWSNSTFTLANVEQETPYTLDLSKEVSDAEGDSLTFNKISGPQWLTLSSAGIISGTPMADDIGDNEFVVSATDGDNNSGNSVNATLIITVTELIHTPSEEEPVNTSPSFVSAVIEKSAVSEGDSLTESLINDATDKQSQLLTYKKISGPQWLTVAEDGSLTGIPSSADIGLNSFTVETSDEQGLSDSATLEIQVIAKKSTTDPETTPDAPADPIDSTAPVADIPAVEEEQTSAGGISLSLFYLLLCLRLLKNTVRKKLC